jgi:hypothetical protein
MQPTVSIQRLQALTEISPTQVLRPKLSGKQTCKAGRSLWRRVCVAGLLCAAEAMASPVQTIPTSNVSEPDKSRYFWCDYAGRLPPAPAWPRYWMILASSEKRFTRKGFIGSAAKGVLTSRVPGGTTTLAP